MKKLTILLSGIFTLLTVFGGGVSVSAKLARNKNYYTERQLPHLHHPCDYQDNADKKPCRLWEKIKKCQQYEHSNQHDDCKDILWYKDDKQYVAINNSYRDCRYHQGLKHWLILPTYPVMGVEDKERRKNYVWQYAWNIAKQKISQRENIALAINPATRRSQHQLHIHIGRVKDGMKTQLNSRNIPHDKHWHSRTISDHYRNRKRETTYEITFTQSLTDENVRPFNLVSKKVGESNMKHTGIIVAGAKKGFYILVAKDKFVEGRIKYECR